MKTRVFVFFLILLSQFIQSQTYQGKVLDAITSEPLETVSVYFDGTTIGTITNSEGFFSIELPDNKNTKSLLVISFVGYQTLTINSTSLKQNTTYNLIEKETSLDEVVLFDDWSRQKKLNIFRRQFLGSDKATLKCEIKNEDVIKLVYSKSNNQLYASTNEPIIIINKALGYKVYYDLVDFEVTFTNCLNCFRGVKTVFYSGTSRFEELSVKKVKSKYIKAREKSYFGSLLHFMRVLSTNETDKFGFKFFIKAPARDSELYFNTNVETVFEIIKNEDLVKVKLLQENKVVIRYNIIEQSALLIQDEDKTFFIDDFGIHSPVDKIIFGGRFGNSRLSTMLPNNYYPN
ncbi:carboxypeptidase-like regulatory domain-containing protein [Aurantibacter sp.]|uniref:carboxypeptidase-like regulatory domain-containing protein n=1 Tax=Aurantibacter sp. TaxID=2807103 RepID=UPI0035C7B013